MSTSPTGEFRPTTTQMLWHYAHGEYPCYLAEDGGPVGWRKYSHRGIQRLDKIHIGSGQKRYVFNKKFDVRVNGAFEQVLRFCAAGREGGFTWISEALICCYLELHRRGYAFSAETWSEGKLVGGLFGVHLGSFVTVDSMFHHVDHASKAAYVQLLLRLQERGFTMIDVNNASEIFSRFGAETVRQWQFEEMMRPLLLRPLPIGDEAPARALPASMRAGLIAERVVRGTMRRARGLLGRAPAAQTGETADMKDAGAKEPGGEADDDEGHAAATPSKNHAA